LPVAGPGFDVALNPGGYAWWYLDAISDDGAHGICIIAFLGSVFSPYYAAARRRRAAEPLDHCAFNIVLTGATRRWCMTERPRARVQPEHASLRIGASTLGWDGSGYQFDLAERGSPLPRAMRGSVRVQPLLVPGLAYALDRAGLHRWAPLAPRARIEVRLREPALSWCGDAYFDSNRGERALEHDFSGWQWSRAALPAGAAVFYETQHRREPPWPLALQFDHTAVRELDLPALVSLPRSGWRIQRQVRSHSKQHTQLLRTLVDAPFYARSLLHTRFGAATVLTVHESLDLNRFGRRWVQWLLPFRMPRYHGRQRVACSPDDAS
jgi:carotenoid 1,2-hydratase